MCTACRVQVNNVESATEAFAEDLLETLNRSALAMAISLGHRTGLFDQMSQLDGWATCEQIADAAGLEERYVREWLGAMVTGGIVAYEASNQTYLLPEHHAALLTRAAGPNNLAATFQWVAVLTEVESDVTTCFKEGGGVPYEKFSRFHEVMAEESKQSVVSGLFEHVLPLTGETVDQLEAGIDVLDIGCGSGRALCAMAERFPRSRFVGRDLCTEPIAAAKAEAEARGLTNVNFEQMDITDLNNEVHHGQFDLVTAFDVIHDQRDPATVLSNVRDMLKSGGTFLMQDIRASSKLEENIEHPLCPFFYVISTMHCMTVSLAQGGAGLGTVWGHQLAVEMLRDAGFENVRVEQLEHDIQNNWYVMQKAA